MPEALIIRRGFGEEQRQAAVSILWEAFAGKLGRVLRSREDAVKVLGPGPGLDPGHTVLALRGDVLLGVMALKDRSGEAMGASLRDYARTYGRLRGPIRLALLALLGEGAPANTLMVDALAVAAEARGQGVGGRLLGEAEAITTERGHRELALDVLADNLGAIRLYERNGYAITSSGRLWPPLSTLFGFTGYHRMTKPASDGRG